MLKKKTKIKFSRITIYNSNCYLSHTFTVLFSYFEYVDNFFG